MKVLRAVTKGPTVIEGKDAQIVLGREVAESIPVSSKEDISHHVSQLLNRMQRDYPVLSYPSNRGRKQAEEGLSLH